MLTRLSLLALALAATTAAQQASDSGLGFLDTQLALENHFGVRRDGQLGVAVDGAGHLWVSVRRAGPTSPHQLVELDRAGNVLGVFDAPTQLSASAFGLRDGTYDAVNQRLYFGSDSAGGGALNVWAFDLGTRAFLPSAHIAANVATPTIRGLTFDGQRFWAADFGATITAFDTSGTQVAAFPSPSDSVYGLAWHPQRGTLWLATQTGLADATTQGGAFAPGVHLLEVDPNNGQLTGHRFRADYLLPSGSNGVSGGAEIRVHNGQFVIDVLVQGAPHDGILELLVDPDVGSGCGGVRMRYSGGNAWAGNPNFALVVDGVAVNSACTMLIGFDTVAATFPGLTNCDLMVNFVTSFNTVSQGTSRVTPLPIPPVVPAIPLSFQAVEVSGIFPVNLSQILWLSLVPPL
ncbi:MAG: hypothetical protein AB7I19_00190 [Planctomycetota bacterium]